MLYEDYQARYDQVLQWQVEEFGEVVDRDVECHAMTEVHIQTYRTPDYLLSCAQDYRPGKPGYQQHTWQATLGIDAVLFTEPPRRCRSDLPAQLLGGQTASCHALRSTRTCWPASTTSPPR